MKVLFAQNLVHLPSHGGASKANRLLAEQLASAGHECHVVAPLTGVLRADDTVDPLDHLGRHGVRDWHRDDDGTVRYRLAGVEVHAVAAPSRLPRRIRSVAATLDPDWVIVPSDDPGAMVLATALAVAPQRVVYLAYTIQQLPCGPAAFYQSAATVDLIRRTAGVLAISRSAQEYLARHAGVSSTLFHPPIYGPVPPIPDAPSTGAALTMVNPCAYKGLALFLALADALPSVPFLAVPTWGTTDDDMRELTRRDNIEIVPAVDDIDVLLRRARVLLMPSLWDETFGFLCVEAMLRGVPVVASAVGGLTEAKLGVPYSLEVRRIAQYDAQQDRARPVPAVPAQDVQPWLAAVRRLLDDPEHHADISGRSRAAAEAFVSGLDEAALERYLRSLSRVDTRAG